MATYPPNTHTVTMKSTSIINPTYGQNTGDYSIASIQIGGEAIPFMVSASPAILQHALTQMKETGFLYLYNGQESLAIRSDKVDAVKLTRMSSTGV